MSTVERQWEHAGLTCVVMVQERGHRCGYVRVPDGHPWHGKSYNDDAPNAKPIDPDLTIDEASESYGTVPLVAAVLGSEEGFKDFEATIAGQVAVHGGVTFAGGALVEEGDGWWFGFDCAHFGDAPDSTAMSEKYRAIEDELLLNHGIGRDSEHGRIWSTDDVAAETERMAEQIGAVTVHA